MTTQESTKNVSITVTGAAAVVSNRGDDQWDVSADVPNLSLYPTHFYLLKTQYPTAPPGSTIPGRNA